jgi:hypothetical protein
LTGRFLTYLSARNDLNLIESDKTGKEQPGVEGFTEKGGASSLDSKVGN